jgi:hypothetical protein
MCAKSETVMRGMKQNVKSTSDVNCCVKCLILITINVRVSS